LTRGPGCDGIATLLDQAKAALAAKKAIRVACAAESIEPLIELLSRRPDVLILDPPAGGGQVLLRVRARSSGTRLLAIDAGLDERRLLRAIKAGAVGYMVEEAIPASLPRTVKAVAAGEARLSRRLMGRVVEEFQRLAQREARKGRQWRRTHPGRR